MKFTLNGSPVEVAAEPHVTLMEVLRDSLGQMGVREACGAGECGACTVVLDGRAVPACLVLAPDAEGRDVVTVEGLVRDGRLDPLPQAFVDAGAVQCGFCTPGMVMSAKALLDRKPDPSAEDIHAALEGNLCRCTGYAKIVEAVRRAAKAR